MKFPALWIAQEGSFAVIDEPLSSCSYLGYRNGFFNGLLFLDSAGDSWMVSEAVLDRQPNFLDRLMNRRFRVDLRLTGPEGVPLAEIVDMLCACVDRDPGDLYDQYLESAKLKRLFRSAQTAPELLGYVRTLGEGIQDRDLLAGQRTEDSGGQS